MTNVNNYVCHFQNLEVKPIIKEVKKEKIEAMEVDSDVSPVLPRLEPMPCKPVFFDLALNHIKMPSLHSRIRELSEKEKPVPKPSKAKKLTQPPKSASKKEAPASASKAAKKVEASEPSLQQTEEEQASIGSKIKNLFWGFK